jgi:rRNA maturation RNase YbeY
MRAFYVPPFRVDITTRPGVPRVIASTELARVAARALAAARAPEPASIGLVLTDDRELARLNRQHMGHSGATDVLSFPLLPPEAFPPHEGRKPPAPGRSTTLFVGPPGRRVHLGDIVVSIGRVVEQAGEGRGGQTGGVRWWAADELRLLVTHGAFHICGWDHADPVEEAAMRALEASTLRLDPWAVATPQ